MSRAIDRDFSELKDYLCDYSLKDVIDAKLESDLKKIHKKIYAYLTLCSEITIQNNRDKIFKDSSLQYLNESVSDVIQSMFLFVNGVYKSSNLILRSSIENLCKAIIGNLDESIYIEKSVYQIFDKVKKDEKFKVTYKKTDFYSVLHTTYAELCKSTHTATNSDMEHLTAMEFIPKYDVERAGAYVKNLVDLIELYICCIAYNYPSIILNMHYTNRDIINGALSSSLKKAFIAKANLGV